MEMGMGIHGEPGVWRGKLRSADAVAGEMMDRYPQLRLVDYGFLYRRDPNFPQDDITWFLLAKPDLSNESHA